MSGVPLSAATELEYHVGVLLQCFHLFLTVVVKHPVDIANGMNRVDAVDVLDWVDRVAVDPASAGITPCLCTIVIGVPVHNE